MKIANNVLVALLVIIPAVVMSSYLVVHVFEWLRGR